MAVKDFFGFTDGTDTYNVNDKSKAPITLLKDTVGWVGKNKADINQAYAENGASKSVSGDDLRVYTTNNASYAAARIPLSLKKNKDYKVSGFADYTSGTGMIIIQYNDGGGWTSLKDLASDITEDTTIDASFNSGNHNAYRLSLNCTKTTAEMGDITFSEIMVYDALIADSTYEPYHKSVEDWYWENNAKTGVHNIFDTANKKGGNATTTTITNNGKNIQVTSNSSTYANSTWYLNVEKNTDYVIKADVAITSGLARLKVQTNGGTVIAESSSVTTDGKIELAFNSGDNEQITFVIFVTFATAGVANVMFNNMFIKLASDTVDYYTDYAMTNRELTELATVKESAVTNIISGASVGDAGNHLIKVGKVVTLTMRLNSVTITAWDDDMCLIPQDYRPKYNLRTLNMFANSVQALQINSSGSVKSTLDLSNATVYIHTTWITD